MLTPPHIKQDTSNTYTVVTLILTTSELLFFNFVLSIFILARMPAYSFLNPSSFSLHGNKIVSLIPSEDYIPLSFFHFFIISLTPFGEYIPLSITYFFYYFFFLLAAYNTSRLFARPD